MNIRTRRWASFLALILTLLAPVEPALAAFARAPRGVAAPAAAPAWPAVLAAGTTVVVAADGDCLRLRSGPGTAQPELRCLPDGSTATIVPGRVELAGTAWQQVRVGDQIGWVAEQYLREAPTPVPAAAPSATPAPAANAGPPIGPGCTPISAAPGAASQQAGPARPPTLPRGINGVVPEAGNGLIVWGGGTTDEVAEQAAARGCALASVWAPGADGGTIGYRFGAPDFVNREWLDRFGEAIEAGTPLVLVCGGIVRAHAQVTPAEDTLAPMQTSPAQAAPGQIAPVPANLPPPAPSGPRPVAVRGLPPPTVSASAIAVVDGSTGAIIYERNAHRNMEPASLTKIATAVLAVETGRLDAWVPVTVDPSELGTDSSVMGLRRGDCFRARDLLYGLLLPSGNDAALALGRFTAGTDEAFVGRMNALVVRLGLRETQFKNADGYHTSGHYSSAYDLAMLARYAMALPDFVDAVRQRQWTAQGSRALTFFNTNTLLGERGIDGVKTGFHEEAGRTLVASATRNGRRVFVVLLNAPDREGDARKLLDWTFTNFVFG